MSKRMSSTALLRPTWRKVTGSFHIKNNTWVTTVGSLNMTSFDDVYVHSIKGIVHLPINGPAFLWGKYYEPVGREENKACSTFAGLPHKPSIDVQEQKQKDSGDLKKRRRGGGGGGFDRGLRGGKCGATSAPCHPASPSSQWWMNRSTSQ